uniref:Uncharacterized protein n=1 Tax=Mycena chlorophos TaxID=658473 RepID=A0ABQ0KTX0_MYCCL|nr:predicted protein [Mycena chlorophos]
MSAPHVDRMNVEHFELSEKITRLNAFFSSDTYKSLDPIDQHLLLGQFGAMQAYASALFLRLMRASAQDDGK